MFVIALIITSRDDFSSQDKFGHTEEEEEVKGVLLLATKINGDSH